MDSGQILHPDEFVEAYAKGAVATPLDTAFRFRDTEVEQVLTTLTNTDVVLVAGRSGVGKSRLALECVRRYAKEHRDAEPFCLFNRGADLFNELRTRFAEPGHYILLVDDANRLTKFDYALDLLRDNRADRKVKIVATVRDYALDTILEKARHFGATEPIVIEGMSSEQIEGLISDTYGITHHAFVERITAIAEGNPRLALMAARVAHEKQSLRALADVSSLYHEYFSSIRQDIQELRDPAALRIAGIVAFLRHVDRSNAELIGLIADTFDVDPNDFWTTIRKLHDLEVFDLYADEVVRVSDQVLSTYLFYLAVFRDRSLDLRRLLVAFFPRFRIRFIEALNPVISTFDAEQVGTVLKDALSAALATYEERGDSEAALHLLDAFAPLVPARALAEAQRMIAALVPESNETAVSVARSNQVVSKPSALSILAHFAYAAEADHAIAIELLVDYANTRRSEVPFVVRILSEQYGINHRSYLEDFVSQRRTAATLAEQARDGRNILASRILIAFAREHLQTEFSRLEPKRGNAFTQYRFIIPASDASLEFRRFLWDQVFALYEVPELRPDTLALFESYAGHMLRQDAVDVISVEAPRVLTFLTSRLDPRDFTHTALMRRFVVALNRIGIAVTTSVREWFDDEMLTYYELLIHDPTEDPETKYDEARQRHLARVANFARGLDAQTLRDFVSRTSDLRRIMTEGHVQFRIEETATQVFLNFAEVHPSDFAEVLLETLTAGNPLGLHTHSLVGALLRSVGADDTYPSLASETFPHRAQWMVAFFTLVPPTKVTDAQLEDLRELYATTPIEDLPFSTEYLAAYAADRTNVVIDIVTTLLARTEADERFGFALRTFFTSYDRFVDVNAGLLPQNALVFKRAYFAANAVDPHTDYDGTVFAALLDSDSGFAEEWVAWIFAQKTYITRHDDSRHYDFIWRRADATAVMRRVLDAIRVASRGRMLFDTYLAVFFRVSDEAKDAADLRAMQDDFLDQMIREHQNDEELIDILFAVISSLPTERRARRIATFLSVNEDVNAFRRLPLEPNERTWSGSAVPMHQRRLEFFESLLPLVNRAALLSHRELLAERIDYTRQEIEREKKRDFMNE